MVAATQNIPNFRVLRRRQRAFQHVKLTKNNPGRPSRQLNGRNSLPAQRPSAPLHQRPRFL